MMITVRRRSLASNPPLKSVTFRMELEAIYIHKCESYHTAARRKDNKLRDHSLTRQGKCITFEGKMKRTADPRAGVCMRFGKYWI